MDSRFKLYGLNCRLNAALNPALFHPQWLRTHQLISEQEADSAKVKFIAENFSLIQIGNINLMVTDSTISLDTVDQTCFEQMRDLAIGIFTPLEAIPIKQTGINTHVHYQFPSDAEWHHFGHTVAPKGHWNSIIESAGTQKLVIRGKNPDCEQGFINITVEPSVRFPHSLYVEINNHNEFRDTKDAQDAIGRLKNTWNKTVKESIEMVEKVVAIK